MPKSPPKYFNRDLSWIEFNARVLEEGRRPDLPPLERLKFMAIVAANFDEFFMVRVGGLQMLADEGVTRKDPSGLTPAEQIKAIGERVRKMVEMQYECYQKDLEEKLAKEKLRRVLIAELADNQLHHIEYVFDNQVFPVLSPIAVTPPVPLPLLQSKALHICVRLKGDAALDDIERCLMRGRGERMEPETRRVSRIALERSRRLAAVRESAAIALAACRSDRARRLAWRALSDPHPPVASAARSALTRLGQAG
jgi:polyphosphate kinase